jgi:hypothetical protein
VIAYKVLIFFMLTFFWVLLFFDFNDVFCKKNDGVCFVSFKVFFFFTV